MTAAISKDPADTLGDTKENQKLTGKGGGAGHRHRGDHAANDEQGKEGVRAGDAAKVADATAGAAVFQGTNDQEHGSHRQTVGHHCRTTPVHRRFIHGQNTDHDQRQVTETGVGQAGVSYPIAPGPSAHQK